MGSLTPWATTLWGYDSIKLKLYGFMTPWSYVSIELKMGQRLHGAMTLWGYDCRELWELQLDGAMTPWSNDLMGL